MHILTISPTLQLSLYNSIQTLPADRYQAACRYELMDTHLPTNETHKEVLETLSREFASIDEKEAEQTLLYNIELGKRLAADNFFPDRLQWAVLVAAENDKPLISYDEDSLVAKLDLWTKQGLTVEMIESSLWELRDGISKDLARYFPARYGQNKWRNFCEHYRQMWLRQLDHAIEDTEASYNAYQESIRMVLSSQKPAQFSGSNPVVLQMETGWQKLQVYLSKNGCSDPRNLSTIEMYTWLDNLEAEQEAQKQALRRGKR